MAPLSSSSSSRPISSKSRRDDDEKRSCCCHPCVIILIVIVLAVVGGILTWQLLPESDKQALIDSVGSGNINIPGTSGGVTGEAPTFDYYRCASEENCCNGVDTICDLRVSDIMFAGLHNAMSSVEDGFLIAGNHEFQVESALQAGFRGINMDVGNCDGKLVFVHSSCSLGTRDPYLVLNNINLFLDTHPTDLILMPLQINNEVDQTVDLFALYDIMASVPGFVDRMYVHDDASYWPTMRSLITNDTRIIVFIYNAGTNCVDGECPVGFHPYFRYATETPFTFEEIANIEDVQTSCQFDRGDQGYRDFYVVNAFVSDPLPSQSSSKVINQAEFLQEHISSCQDIVNRPVNMVLIDFWEEGDLVDMVQDYNMNLGGSRRQLE